MAKTETLHAPAGTPNEPPSPKTEKAKRGDGHTITIDLKDYPELLAQIKSAAKEDDREPSKWVRRRLVQIHGEGYLFAGAFTDDEPNPDDK